MTATLRRWWFGTDRDNRLVVPVALALVAAHVAYRCWASLGSWWEGDDFVYIARVFEPGGRTVGGLMASYAGHMIPADFYVTWLLNRVGPYSWTPAALTMTAMHLLAAVGFLRLLLVGFGRRWGIIPPLALFLFTSFTVQSAVWWATAIQALPFEIVLCWALGSQLSYLRTGRSRSALAALAWVAIGMAFYEKTVLVIGALAIVTFAYYTHGSWGQRVKQVWTSYRVSLVGNVVLGAAFLAVYVHYGLNFSPRAATDVPIGPTADVMILRSWGTGVVGGPLQWSSDPANPLSYAKPSSLLALAAWVAIFLVVREIARSRTGTLRAVALPVYFLVCDVLLVVASRTYAFGSVIGFELRYLTEMSAVTGLALALATLPLRGSVAPVRVVRPSNLLDRRRPALVATALVAALGLVSTTGYITNWHRGQFAQSFYDNLTADAMRAPAKTATVDDVLPGRLIWEFASPYNTLRYVLRPLNHRLHYVQAATDDVLMLSPDGHLAPMDVTPVRQAVAATADMACANRVDSTADRTIRLNGPLAFGGWWVKVSYIASADSAITVSAGGVTQQTSVVHGLHDLYFQAGTDTFETIQLGRMVGDAHLCTNNVVVGRPVAREIS